MLIILAGIAIIVAGFVLAKVDSPAQAWSVTIRKEYHRQTQAH